jgi:hypothetical protein
MLIVPLLDKTVLLTDKVRCLVAALGTTCFLIKNVVNYNTVVIYVFAATLRISNDYLS